MKTDIRVQQMVEAGLLKLANRIALEVVRTTVQVLDENEVNVTGDLRKSIENLDATRVAEGILAQVVAGMGYAAYEHEGTKPHWPPIEPIARWVERKGIGQSFSVKSHKMVGHNKKGVLTSVNKSASSSRVGSLNYRQFVPSERQYSQEVRHIAYLIARKIARKGTTGVKFFEIALERAWPKAQELIREFKPG